MHGERSEPSIGDLAAALDAERFVGRAQLLEQIDRALSRAVPIRILHVHGPGGVGKSALLRAAGRRAAAAGHPVLALDGRVIEPTPDALAEALTSARTTVGPARLVLLDEVDELNSLRVELRRLVLEVLPATTVVVTAGRRAPGPEWLDHGLDRVTATVDLLPLGPVESRSLLARAGVEDPEQVGAITAWSAGYPLALTLAAGLQEAGSVPAPTRAHTAAPAAHLDELLLGRLGGAELRGIDPELLDVAAIAPAVDGRLLAAVLPGRSTRGELAALRACSLSEPIGPRVTLHRLARTALRARLREAEPERHRQLVVGIADHIRARADTEGMGVITELASLVENPDVRLGFDRSPSHYADHARPGDAEHLAAATGGGGTAWFGRVARWIDEHPRQVVTVRRVTGELAGAGIVYNRDTIPDWARDSVEVGPVVEHARAEGHLDGALFFQDMTIVEEPVDAATEAEIIRVGNAALVAFNGRGPVRHGYVTSVAGTVTQLEYLGYVDVPELDRGDGDRELRTIWCDFGPAGLVGRAHDLVRAEQGEPPWADSADGVWMADALRSFHDDGALRAVTGLEPDEARSAVRAAVGVAFADDSDRDLRRALERTYLDPEGGHAVAQRELFMSRSSFYRLLQRARRQLLDGGGTSS